MAKNRIFLPQELVDHWVQRGVAELVDDELLLFPHRRRYRLVEAAHVMSEVTGAPDPFGVVGQVKTLNYLLELGAELLGDSMIIGDAAFRVVQGFLGAPLGSFEQYLTLLGPVPARAHDDAELLSAFAARNA